MGCGGMGGCGGGSSSSQKSSNHSTKKQPNWGMTKQPGSSTQAARAAAGGFGTPKVKMSFRGKK